MDKLINKVEHFNHPINQSDFLLIHLVIFERRL
jgi:hypothetical protein